MIPYLSVNVLRFLNDFGYVKFRIKVSTVSKSIKLDWYQIKLFSKIEKSYIFKNRFLK